LWQTLNGLKSLKYLQCFPLQERSTTHGLIELHFSLKKLILQLDIIVFLGLSG
jgi:hypothetical protein